MTLLTGFLVSSLSVGVTGGNLGYGSGLTLPPIAPPVWFFGAVWVAICPTLGIVTWHAWQWRHDADISGPMSLFAVMLLSSFIFLPVSVFADGHPAVVTILDLNGLFVAHVLAWLDARFSTIAVWWLAPLLLWMPLTTLCKAWLLALNL